MHDFVTAETFSGRNVFITGHTGFKGAWLALWLSELGANVTGYALEPPTNPSHFELAHLSSRMANHVVGDLRDREKLQEAMSTSQPDVVLHLAAETVVRRAYEIPYETFEINVMGTASVLEAARNLDKPCAIVAVTTDKCYENKDQVWGYRENDAMGSNEPYATSKAAAELLIETYRRSFFPPEHFDKHGIKLASARAGNVVGGGDWTRDALVVDVIRALAENDAIEVRSPSALRPWQHVLDALSGYLTLAQRMLESDDPTFSSGWNFGPLPGNEIPVKEVVELLIQQWGDGHWVDVSDQNSLHESQTLRLAIDKAIWGLKWKPQWNVSETFLHTVDWYRAFLQNSNTVLKTSLEQIQLYESQLQHLPSLTPAIFPSVSIVDTHQESLY